MCVSRRHAVRWMGHAWPVEAQTQNPTQGWVQPDMAWAPSQHGRSTQDTAPVLQGSDRDGRLGGRIWDRGGRPMHRHWNLQAPSRARIGVRLQPAPAAAPPDQPYHSDSSLVCRSRSGPLRAGTPPSHHDRGVGISSSLALIGAWDAVLGLQRFR